MINPGLEMHRLAGKFAVLLAGVYLLVVFGAIVAASTGDNPPLVAWLLLPLPAFAFTPSVLDALRLHRTTDPSVTRTLWRRCLLLAAVGLVLLVAAALTLGRVS